MASGVVGLKEILADFILHNVEKTGGKMMAGAYGTVEPVEINKLQCALKTLHSQLVQEVSVPRDKFVEECRVLAKMKHPNVVQFLGVHFSDESPIPGLVMEWLPFSLPSFLTQWREKLARTLPKELSCSILFDIAKGMNYLHDQNIIHRDLSPKNILLTSALVAKVADLGMIKIIDPMKTARTLTMNPGTPLITAPEATDNLCSYGNPVDVFAFGYLMLMTAKGDWPTIILKDKELVDEERQLYRILPPLERYQPEIDEYMPKGDVLRELTIECLEAKPQNRPTSHELVCAFSKLAAQFPSPFNDPIELLQSKDEARQLKEPKSDKTKVDCFVMDAPENANNASEGPVQTNRSLEEEVAQLRRTNRALMNQLEEKNQGQTNVSLEEELAELRRQVRILEGELESRRDQEIARVEEEQQHRQLQRQVEDLRRTLEEVRGNLNEVMREKNGMEQRLEESEKHLAEVEEEKNKIEQELFEHRRKLQDFNNLSVSMSQSLPGNFVLPPVLPPTLDKTEAMPLVDNENARLRIKEVRQTTVSLPHIKGAQAVIIRGKVYVGRVSNSLWVYDVIARSWEKIPQEAPVRNYALANFQDQLALVGGSGINHVSKKVYIWSQEAWNSDRIRPMNEERENPIAVGYTNYLVAMGGSAAKFRGLFTATLQSIEVYHFDKEQWQYASQLPRTSYMLQSVALDGFLYILSSDGWTVRYCSLADLVRSSEVKLKESLWKSIARSVPHTRCCIAVFNNTLLAIAGAGSDGSIYAFNPKHTRWQKIVSHNSLPAIKNACCLPVGAKDLFLCGGDIDLMTDAPQSAYSLTLEEMAP